MYISNCQASIESSASSTVTELQVAGHTNDHEGSEGKNKDDDDNVSEDEMDKLLHCSGINGWETDLDDESEEGEMEVDVPIDPPPKKPNNPDEYETLDYIAHLEMTEESQWKVYGSEGERWSVALQKPGSPKGDEKDS